MKLLALDIENTIITGYKYDERATKFLDMQTGDVELRFHPIIDPKLAQLLSIFHKHNWIIVTATGTAATNIHFYKTEFDNIGIGAYISCYIPNDHDEHDHKWQKLDKYQTQFNIIEKNQTYFFDDSKENVLNAINHGYINAKQVTKHHTLTYHLQTLLRDHPEWGQVLTYDINFEP